VHRFLVQSRAGRPLDTARSGARLTELLLAVHAGRLPDDGLNRLVVEADLDWRAVDCLRAYAGYAVQLGIAARSVLGAALANNAGPAARLFACFVARFAGPSPDDDAPGRFLASLDGVEQLREDRCLRALAALVRATVRTTFFARQPECDRLVLKFRGA